LLSTPTAFLFLPFYSCPVVSIRRRRRTSVPDRKPVLFFSAGPNERSFPLSFPFLFSLRHVWYCRTNSQVWVKDPVRLFPINAARRSFFLEISSLSSYPFFFFPSFFGPFCASVDVPGARRAPALFQAIDVDLLSGNSLEGIPPTTFFFSGTRALSPGGRSRSLIFPPPRYTVCGVPFGKPVISPVSF